MISLKGNDRGGVESQFRDLDNARVRPEVAMVEHFRRHLLCGSRASPSHLCPQFVRGGCNPRPHFNEFRTDVTSNSILNFWTCLRGIRTVRRPSSAAKSSETRNTRETLANFHRNEVDDTRRRVVNAVSRFSFAQFKIPFYLCTLRRRHISLCVILRLWIYPLSSIMPWWITSN